MQHFTKVSLPAAVKITCLCTSRFALVYSCRSVSSQRRDEWQSHLVQICLSAESSQRMKRPTDVEKGPKSQKLDLSRDLILLCEASFHVANDRRVWTPTVSKCLVKIARLRHQRRRILRRNHLHPQHIQDNMNQPIIHLSILGYFSPIFSMHWGGLLEVHLEGTTNA